MAADEGWSVVETNLGVGAVAPTMMRQGGRRKEPEGRLKTRPPAAPTN